MLEPRIIRMLPTQKKVWDCKAATACCIAGIGTGKTLSLGWLLAREAYKYPNNVIVVAAATAPQLKMSTVPTSIEAWQMMGIAYNYKEYKAMVEFPNGSLVKFQSLDVPAAELKGSTLGALFVDEIDACSLPHIEALRGRVRRPLTSRVQRFFGNSPPPGHWLENVFTGERTWGPLFQATTYENQFLPEDYLRSCEGQWPVGTAQHDRFMLGKMGVALQGAVYPEFKPELHCITEAEVPEKLWRFGYGLDLGFNHPTVLLEGGLADDGTLYVLREYSRAGALLVQHAESIKQIYRGGPIWSDHDLQDRWELNALGINTIPADKAVTRGIEHVRRRLRNKTIKIVKAACPGLIREFPRYVWKESLALTEERPEKKEDDHVDALRYLVVGLDAEDAQENELYSAFRESY